RDAAVLVRARPGGRVADVVGVERAERLLWRGLGGHRDQIAALDLAVRTDRLASRHADRCAASDHVRFGEEDLQPFLAQKRFDPRPDGARCIVIGGAIGALRQPDPAWIAPEKAAVALPPGVKLSPDRAVAA